MREPVPVSIFLADVPVASETVVTPAGAYALVLSTSIAAPRAAYGMHSSYLGQRDQPTAATHVLLLPDGASELIQRRHDAHALPVADDERHACLYDHLQELLTALVSDGRDARIDVGDHGIAVVNR